MVGVPRSTGCKPCRKAKVKCDELKPVCGRCIKGARACTYSDKYKFVPEISKQTSSADAEQHAAALLLVKPKRGIFLYTTEKRMKNGDLMQKWHRSTLSSPPRAQPLSPTDIQGYQLIKCWDEGPRGMRFDLCAAWVRQLPARLGRSPALDDAANFMARVHDLMLQEQDPSRWLCPASYIKALRSLRKALANPREGYSIETLTAAMVLYHVEEKLGDPFYNTIQHAGGIGKLLEKRGTIALQSSFDWEVIAQIQGPIISRSVMLGIPCFLSQPSWMKYIESYEATNERTAIVQEFCLWISHWPSLTAKMRQLREGILPLEGFRDMRTLILKIRSRLDALEVVVDEYTATSKDADLVPAQRPRSPIAKVYDFHDDSSWPALINNHCAYILVLDHMLDYMDQLGYPLYTAVPQIQRRVLKADQHQRLITKICRAYEWTTTVRPLMSSVPVLALTTAYHYAYTVELQEWLMNALNESIAQRQKGDFLYTAQTMEYVNNLIIGAIDLPTMARQMVANTYGDDTDTTSGDDTEFTADG